LRAKNARYAVRSPRVIAGGKLATGADVVAGVDAVGACTADVTDRVGGTGVPPASHPVTATARTARAAGISRRPARLGWRRERRVARGWVGGVETLVRIGIRPPSR